MCLSEFQLSQGLLIGKEGFRTMYLPDFNYKLKKLDRIKIISQNVLVYFHNETLAVMDIYLTVYSGCVLILIIRFSTKMGMPHVALNSYTDPFLRLNKKPLVVPYR